jgi:hypothetical protein
MNLKIKSTQSFRSAHRNRIYIYIFIEMNIYIYYISKKKKNAFATCGQFATASKHGERCRGLVDSTGIA